MRGFIVTHGIRIAKDFVPETHSRLTTQGPKFLLPVRNGTEYKAYQVCQCDCGNVVCIRTNDLKTLKVQSCGCLRLERLRKVLIKHNKTGEAYYRQWICMVERCENPKTAGYHLYGGRGISVHPDWRDDVKGPQNFYDYMGPRPSPEHSVDRYPNKDGNYEPGNVRWATDKEQARNRRNNVNLTHNGKTQCLAAWAEEVGMSVRTLRYRIKAGWPLEAALTNTTARKNKLRD